MYRILEKHTLAFVITVLVGCTTLAGCMRTQTSSSVKTPEEKMPSSLADKPERLRPGYSKIVKEGQRNSVLNHMCMGTDALQLEYRDLAAISFDRALLGIETVYANNPRAQMARSLWYEEGMKDFKGEPYERAMAYYYRGLLYMWEDDYENARACFKSGVIQDAFAEEEQYRSDFALLIFLEGWTSMQIGDRTLAEEAWKEVRKLRPDHEIPSSGSNTLLIVETGNSPRKVSDGIGHAELKFRRGRNFDETRVKVSIDNGEYTLLYPVEDIAWQAMTRGGRAVDKILQAQVVFRKRHERLGTVLTDAANAISSAGLYYPATPETQDVAAALGILGVASMALAIRARPQADTRYWSNLPDAVHIGTFHLEPGMHSVHLKFTDPSGKEISHLGKTTYVQILGDEPTLVWHRSRYQIFSDKIDIQ